MKRKVMFVEEIIENIRRKGLEAMVDEIWVRCSICGEALPRDVSREHDCVRGHQVRTKSRLMERLNKAGVLVLWVND